MQLLCLLLSARGRPKEALTIATAALEDHPDSMDLLRILALLQLRCEGGEVRIFKIFQIRFKLIINLIFCFQSALATGKHMLSIWKTLNESGAVIDLTNDFDRKSETRSVLQLYNDRDSTKDSSKYLIQI